MKKKLGILVAIMIVIGIIPVFAVSVSDLDIVNYEKVIAEGCKEYACGIGADLINLETGVPKGESDSKTYNCNCDNEEECEGFSVTFKPKEELKYAYKGTKEELNQKIVLEINRDGEEEAHSDFISQSKSEYKKILIDKYTDISVRGNKYCVLTTLVDKLDPNGKARLLYAEHGGVLNIVAFNKEKMDIYINQEVSDRPDSKAISRYKIGSIFIGGKEEASGAVKPNNGNNIGFDNNKETFLVCENHRKCEGACEKNVASSGEGSVQGTTYLSRYCPKETCAFIWDVTNRTNTAGGNLAGIDGAPVEGLVCKEEKIEGAEYCKAHKCVQCPAPIIGVNVNDALNDVLVYSGDNLGNYSKYCERDFCTFSKCREIRSNKTVSGSATNWTNFCQKHNEGKCSVVDCNNKATRVYQGKAPICEAHVDEYFNRHPDGKLEIKENIECGNPTCQNTSRTVKIYEDGLCAVCKIEKENVLNDDNATDDEKIELQVKNELIAEEGYTNETLKTPEGLAEIEKRIEKIKEEIKKGKEEVNSKFANCEKCGNLTLIYVMKDGKILCQACGGGEEAKDGIALCPKCGMKKNISRLKINGGVCGWCAGRYNATLTFDQVGNIIGGSLTPDKCTHSEWPVPINVTVANLNNGTHKQTWNCLGCSLALEETYEHMYDSNRSCVCGQIRP